jgi:hypothetical protein
MSKFLVSMDFFQMHKIFMFNNLDVDFIGIHPPDHYIEAIQGLITMNIFFLKGE